jgi:hypothetical protein
LQFRYFISSKLKIGLYVGKIVAKTLGIVGYASHGIVAVDVEWINRTGHEKFLARSVLDIYLQ